MIPILIIYSIETTNSIICCPSNGIWWNCERLQYTTWLYTQKSIEHAHTLTYYSMNIRLIWYACKYGDMLYIAFIFHGILQIYYIHIFIHFAVHLFSQRECGPNESRTVEHPWNDDLRVCFEAVGIHRAELRQKKVVYFSAINIMFLVVFASYFAVAPVHDGQAKCIVFISCRMCASSNPHFHESASFNSEARLLHARTFFMNDSHLVDDLIGWYY